MPRALPRTLRRLSLAFSNKAYFEFAGFTSKSEKPFQAIRDKPLICFLAEFLALEHVNFHFHILPPKKIDNDVICS
jgi:hypothetical protein